MSKKKTPGQRQQYKPVGFGDPYDPESVEGHRNTVRERAENRRADLVIRAT
jgi:hypothetical protein